MSGAIPPLPQYAFTEWCSIKARGRLKEIGWEGVDWIHLALVNTVINLWTLLKCGEFFDQLSDLLASQGLRYMELVDEDVARGVY